MIFLGTPQLCGGVDILFFFKVSFEKHPNNHTKTMIPWLSGKGDSYSEKFEI